MQDILTAALAAVLIVAILFAPAIVGLRMYPITTRWVVAMIIAFIGVVVVFPWWVAAIAAAFVIQVILNWIEYHRGGGMIDVQSPHGEMTMGMMLKLLGGLLWLVAFAIVSIYFLYPPSRSYEPFLGMTMASIAEAFGLYFLIIVLGVNTMGAWASYWWGSESTDASEKFDLWTTALGMTAMILTAILFFVGQVGNGPDVTTAARNLLFMFALGGVFDFAINQAANWRKHVKKQPAANARRYDAGSAVPYTDGVSARPRSDAPAELVSEAEEDLARLDSRTEMPQAETVRYIDIHPVYRLVMPNGDRVIVPPTRREQRRVADYYNQPRVIEHQPQRAEPAAESASESDTPAAPEAEPGERPGRLN